MANTDLVDTTSLLLTFSERFYEHHILNFPLEKNGIFGAHRQPTQLRSK